MDYAVLIYTENYVCMKIITILNLSVALIVGRFLMAWYTNSNDFMWMTQIFSGCE